MAYKRIRVYDRNVSERIPGTVFNAALYNNLQDGIDSNSLRGIANGTSTITIYDAASAGLFNLEITGTTDQGESPSPENSQEIRSTGDGGNLNVIITDGNQSKTITIPLTKPLWGIEDDRDCIICKDGIWGIERIFTSIMFDGSADENWYTTDTSIEGKIRYGYRLSGKMADKSNPTALCSHFALTQRGATASGITGFAINDVMLIYYDGRPLAEFKTWLAANPITIVYQPVDPTWEPFSSDIQTALNSLTTYRGKTTISVTADGPAADIKVEYARDINMVIADIYTQISALKGGSI